MYSLKIKDKNDNYIEEITSWQNFSYWWELNRPGGARITFNIDDIKFDTNNFFPARHYVDIFRGDRKIWSGIFTLTSGNIGDISGNQTACFEGYLWLLRKMFISAAGKNFTYVDMGTILWTLINDFQNLPNGSYGITQGDISTGINKDRTYSPFKNIYDAFMEMSEVENGADFEITENKALNVYRLQGRRLSSVFEYGKNITKVYFNFNANDLVNSAYAIGSGEGVDLLYSIAHNIQSQEIFGLMQDTISHPDVVMKGTLIEHAKEWTKVFSEPTEIYAVNVKPFPDPTLKSYGIGDDIRLKINKGYLSGIDTYRRVKKITVSVDSNEKEDVRVEFFK